MTSAALHAAGHRVGRYTSPHLLRLEERFVVQEVEVETSELRKAAGGVQAAVEALLTRGTLEGPPTFFECTTAAAFEIFRRAGVEIAVLEVGLGGRLDATNVVSPLAAAITSIDLDHEAQLGSTLASIAREKAGIIKPGVPVVAGPLPPEADMVVAETCGERGARLTRVGRDVKVDAVLRDGFTFVSIVTPYRQLLDVPLALPGRHQAGNAGVAVALLDELCRAGIEVDDEAAAAGLRRTQWPARLERLRWRGCDVLLDAAHNPAGARSLAAYLRETNLSDVTLVFGAMRDKDVGGMLKELLPFCAVVICATAPGSRALEAAELGRIAAGLAGSTVRVETIAEPGRALMRACELGRSVVAAGSIFLIGPLRDILR
jgi:dihydrofolate synthase/folylpolyglutamate synthase